MNTLLLSKQIDLIRVNELCFFALRHDNLYTHFVPPENKNQSLINYQERIRSQGYALSPINQSNQDTIKSSEFVVELVMTHLWKRNIIPTILDLGSWIGDFSLKMGNLARTFNKKSLIIAFDPTEAGSLINFNIELNHLESWIKYEDKAVADIDGLIMMEYRHGHSDSAAIKSEFNNSQTTPFILSKVRAFALRCLGLQHLSHNISTLITPAINILSYIYKNNILSDLFVKIDIEGSDYKVIRQLSTLLPNRQINIIFEFSPSSFVRNSIDPTHFLENLTTNFILYDIFYSPNPTRCQEIYKNNIQAFVTQIQNRTYGYTDILAIDKRTSDLNELQLRLSQLDKKPDSYILCPPSSNSY